MLNTDEMIDMVLDAVGYERDGSDLSREETMTFLRLAHIEILNKFHFKQKEQRLVVTTDADSQYVSLSSLYSLLDHVKHIAILDTATGKPALLTATDDRNAATEKYAENTGTPTHYHISYDALGNPRIELFPIPDAIYTLNVTYETYLPNDIGYNPDIADFMTGLPIPYIPRIPQAWHEVIVMGATWRILLMKVRDMAAANEVRAHTMATLNTLTPEKAKEEQNMKTAGLELLREPYDL